MTIEPTSDRGCSLLSTPSRTSVRTPSNRERSGDSAIAKVSKPDTPGRVGELGGGIDSVDKEATTGGVRPEGGVEQGGGDPEEDDKAGGETEEKEEEEGACDGGVGVGDDTGNEEDEDKPRTTSQPPSVILSDRLNSTNAAWVDTTHSTRSPNSAGDSSSSVTKLIDRCPAPSSPDSPPLEIPVYLPLRRPDELDSR